MTLPVAILGNLALDRIDGGPPQPGGCPVFAALALRLLDRPAQLLARCAAADQGLFDGALQAPGRAATILLGPSGAGFDHRYEGETRVTTVTAIGEAWTPGDAAHLAPAVRWLHAAPLLRSDFPAPALAALAASGRRVSLDGQGLTRAASLGPLTQNGDFDPALLSSLSVLKLSQEEAQIVAHGAFGACSAERLGVPEILVTLGSRGAELYLGGSMTHVPTTPVLDVQSTGAGDAFMVAYVLARSDGACPLEAARLATSVVVRMLRERRALPPDAPLGDARPAG